MSPSLSSSDGADRVAQLGDVVDGLELSWVFAVLAVIVVWYGSKLLTERLRPRLEERVLRPTTANAVLLAGRVAIVCYALVPFAGLLGFRPENVLLSFTVLSLVVGAVLAPIGRSYISGLFIIVHRPYEVGDMIELVDREERGTSTTSRWGTRGSTPSRTRFSSFRTRRAQPLVPGRTQQALDRGLRHLRGRPRTGV
ncbi:mechanosensitive ion channel family protein [Natronorubrum halophilum]|uniref:mechanosensitive ion channel family protein n=1 Tax=Natronorubrum halophilum TaxID=1702106 RepID=UPI001EE9A66E|nr:mechanosensitive ion channel family protein [Natronorubrum halophilum]